MGPAYKTIKYDSNGCAIDHVVLKEGVPLSAVWEIWGDNSTLRLLHNNNFMRLSKKPINSE